MTTVLLEERETEKAKKRTKIQKTRLEIETETLYGMLFPGFPFPAGMTVAGRNKISIHLNE
ncbi:MAG: hypothetical protein J7M18_00340 [Candidatus Eremiobacteraeota bacterium]|nr:hypothetical protein [Candidatus Eremiobacteraeota bacterium]